MKLLQLKYFRTVAELGKINLAAESLYISSPALSSSIASLENELGVILFDRTSNRITLNEQGKIFLRYVNQIFYNLDCAKLELQQSLADTKQSVHIAVTTSNIWTGMISAFALEYPHITISCSTLKMSQLHNINISRINAFILAERSDFYSEDMESIPLFTEQPVAVIPPSHPLAGREKVELSELADEIMFIPMADQSLNKRIKELFYTCRVPIKHVNECADSICRSMVIERRGISIATTHTSGSGMSSLCQIPISAPDCHWEQRIYWNKNNVLTAEETLFKEFILNMYQVKTSG